MKARQLFIHPLLFPSHSRKPLLQSRFAIHSLLVFCAVFAALWAVGIGHSIFPYLSNNTDEAVYLLQAKALLQGKLWLPRTPLSDFFLSWFEKYYGDKIVFKYTPVHAFILAAAKYLSGNFSSAPAGIAVVTILCMYSFCRELGLPRKTALLASVFVLLSPAFLILSATYLPYCSSLALTLAFATLLLRGMRLGSPVLLCLAGIIQGLTFFCRPYDTVLFSAVWCIFYLPWRTSMRSTLSHCGWALAGLVPILIMAFFFNAETTGHPLIFPFQQYAFDTFGFGIKRVFMGVGILYFDLNAALDATAKSFWQLGLWVFGSLISVIVVVGFLAKTRLRRRERALCAMLAVYPLGYFFFWGPFNMMSWGALYYLGPNYYLPCLVPFAIFAARGFRLLMRRRNTAFITAFLLMIVMPVLTCCLLADILRSNAEFTAKSEQIYRPLAERNALAQRNDIIFVTPIYGPYLLHPFKMLSNDGVPQGPVIYAVNRSMENFKLFDAYPQRQFFRFDSYGTYSENPLIVPKTRLVPLRLQKDTAQLLSVNITTPPSAKWVRICAASSAKDQHCLFDEAAKTDKLYRLSIQVTAKTIRLLDASPAVDASRTASVNRLTLSADSPFTLRAEFYTSSVLSERNEAHMAAYEYRYLLRNSQGQLQAIDPPEQWSHEPTSKTWHMSHLGWLCQQKPTLTSGAM